MAPRGKSLGRLPDRFTEKNVGSTLLEDLAKGVYKPDEVIREYVQNAVDAHRLWSHENGDPIMLPIHIEVRDNKITIYDYGIGMDAEDISNVKSIGVSPKREADVPLAGYKGVGIWAGLSYFEKMSIYSTKQGEDRGYLLSINFKKIVDAIDVRTNIGDAIRDNYSIDPFEEATDEHLTIVTLEAPTLRAQAFFVDADQVRDAVRNLCPCQFDPSFQYPKEIEQFYRLHSLDQFPIMVAGEYVYKKFPPGLVDFEEGTITIDDTPIAFYWRAVNKENERYDGDEFFYGFRMYLKGFELGEVNPYSGENSLFPPITLAKYLFWYAGEIHVTHQALRPDLRRREFEEGEIARQFVLRLRNWYQQTEADARDLSPLRTYLKHCIGYDEHVSAVEDKAKREGLSQEDIEQLEAIKNKLKGEADKAKTISNKSRTGRRKTFEHEYKELFALTEAKKSTPARQRSLLRRIDHLLPAEDASGAASQTEEAKDSHGKATSDGRTSDNRAGDTSTKEDGTSHASTATREATTTATTPSNGTEEAEDESEQSYRLGFVLPEVALALLDEILSEEIASDTALAVRIRAKFRKRMQSVMRDV